jgi:hypothetical protein
LIPTPIPATESLQAMLMAPLGQALSQAPQSTQSAPTLALSLSMVITPVGQAATQASQPVQEFSSTLAGMGAPGSGVCPAVWAAGRDGDNRMKLSGFQCVNRHDRHGGLVMMQLIYDIALLLEIEKIH